MSDNITGKFVALVALSLLVTSLVSTPALALHSFLPSG
jgi:hypothetical protein